MRYFLTVICLSIVLSSCDDGDILTIELDFDKNLELCDNNSSQYVVYDTRTDPSESLSLIYTRNATTEAYFNTVNDADTPYELTIGASGTSFNYRSYNTDPTFCDIIPNSELIIQEDYESTGGIVKIITSVLDTDNDGISNADENQDPNGDGDFSDAQDTDGDNLPDYIDQDDDNDNVLTINEDNDNDGDDNPFTDPRDTDGDSIPDYLDNDDDGDGILTRLEDEDENEDPTNDFLTDEPDQLPRFLEPAAAEQFLDPGFRNTQFTRTFTSTFTIENLGIEILSVDNLDFGTYVGSTTTFTVEN